MNDQSIVRAYYLARRCSEAGAELAWNHQADRIDVTGAPQLPAELRDELKAQAGADLDEAARPGLESRRALRLVLSAHGMGRDALFCPIAALPTLATPCTLHCERQGRPFVVTTSRAGYEEARKAGVPAFVAREANAAARAAELGRAAPAHLDQWLANKLKSEWVLTLELSGALDVLSADRDAQSSWTVGRLLDALGAHLDRVFLHERAAA